MQIESDRHYWQDIQFMVINATLGQRKLQTIMPSMGRNIENIKMVYTLYIEWIQVMWSG